MRPRAKVGIRIICSSFLKSTEFEECIVKACVSSIPRWRYLRELERDPSKKSGAADRDVDSDSDDDFEYVSVVVMPHVMYIDVFNDLTLGYTEVVPKDLKGVARAQKGLLDSTRRILRAKDPLAELLIDRGYSSSVLRLMSWRSLAATAVYLSDKNLPYTSPI